MNIFDFITQDEIEDLPEDDPQTAFTSFIRIAQRRLGDRLKSIAGNDQSDWEEIKEARLGFMNVAIAAAKKYQIEPFSKMVVPRIKDFDSEVHHRQFKADLDHYLTQLLLDNSSRAKRDSVLISPTLKTAIHTYVFHLRELIEKADDLDPAKRELLLRRLSEFEAALEKKRLNLMAVTMLLITFASAPGGIWASMEPANKVLTSILRLVGEAKNADDAARLPPTEPPMAITGPRPDDSGQADFGSDDFGKRSKSDMDDEIPF